MRKKKPTGIADEQALTNSSDNQQQTEKGGVLRIPKVLPRVGIIILTIVAVIVFIAAYFRISAAMESSSFWLIFACAVAVICCTIMMMAYLYAEERSILTRTRQLIAVATLIVFATGFTVLMTFVNPAFNAAFLAIILCGMLISRRSAYMMTLVMAGMCMLISLNRFGEGAMDMPSAVGIAVLLGGISAVLALNVSSSRLQPIAASLIGGIVAAVAVVCIKAVCKDIVFPDILLAPVWMLAGCFLCGVLATGLMPVFERLFDFTTETRLNELLNTNNPLLKRLMLEAPGTYHHSLIVSVMAESAAELIGANALLCKTAAFYHDVGKLTSPKYFKENQGEYNIHDDLPPEESARYILAHPKDSAALLEKNKFPSEIVRMARQHHGDSVVAFFYNKAKTLAEDPNSVDINNYRYDSSKPHTKEDAILMLADCCEAAVRAIKRPTKELIEERVHSIVNNLWRSQDGQLTESPLTAQDVFRIEESFISNLLAQYHERIEYPVNMQQNSLPQPQGFQTPVLQNLKETANVPRQ